VMVPNGTIRSFSKAVLSLSLLLLGLRAQ